MGYYAALLLLHVWGHLASSVLMPCPCMHAGGVKFYHADLLFSDLSTTGMHKT